MPRQAALPIRPDESELPKRIRSALGDESQASFARRSQISEPLLRQYLRGTMPSADRLVRMADAAGVSVEWLATGRGQRERAARVPDVTLGDLGRLRTALAGVEEGLRSIGRTLPPDKYAALVAAAYELTDPSDPHAGAKVLRFVTAAA